MSAQQWFNEVEAVVGELQDYVQRFTYEGEGFVHGAEEHDVLDVETFTAVWQAAELLSRAHAVLLPMMQLEAMKRLALDIPDPEHKTPKKAHLYGPNGKPL